MKPTKEVIFQLYERERLSTRETAKALKIDRRALQKYMTEYGIRPRAASRGLANRGIAAPTSNELQQLIHIEHKSYEDIARQYGVDKTAITHWVRKHGIKPPAIWETRRRGKTPQPPTKERLMELHAQGLSIRSIASKYNVSQQMISKLFDEYGLVAAKDGWNGGLRIACQDGHEVRSSYEQRVDDWLSKNNIPHVYEPRLPFDKRSKSDFYANSWYIEIWGVWNNDAYRSRQERKRELYKVNSCALIELPYWTFQGEQIWLKRIAVCLQTAINQLTF